MRYSEQSDNGHSYVRPSEIQPLLAMKHHIDYMCYSAQKQTTIYDFFDVELLID